MAAPIAAAAAAGLIGKILSGFGVGNNPQEWIQDALVSLYNRAQQGDEMARQMFAAFADPARDLALDTTGALSRPVIDLAPFLMQSAQDNLSGVNPTLQQFLAQGQDMSGAGGINDLLMSLLPQTSGVGSTAAAGFQGGGWTPQGQSIFDALGGLMTGQGNNAQLALGDVGPNLIGQRGQTALTQTLGDRGMEAANNRGMNPTLDAALAAALDTVQNQGYNEVSGGLAGRGFDILDTALGRALGTPLMGPEEAANWARERAVSLGEQQREKFYDEATKRGGGPGAISSGLQNQAKIDFGDAILANASDEARKAFIAQQELMLRDRANAGSVAGLGGSLAGQGEQLAAGRTGQAFGAIPGATNAATGAMSALLDAALGGGNLENARMNTGTNMSNALLNSILQANQGAGSTLANQNQYALGLGNLANQSQTQQANILNSILGNNLSAGQFGNQLAQTSLGGQNSALNSWGNIWNNMAGATSQFANPLTQLAGQSLNYAGQNVNLMGAPFGNLRYTGNATPWEAIGNLVGGVAGNLGR